MSVTSQLLGRDHSLLDTEKQDTVSLTLFIPMDYFIHKDTISMELSILLFKELLVKIPVKRCFSVPIVFTLASSADPD